MCVEITSKLIELLLLLIHSRYGQLGIRDIQSTTTFKEVELHVLINHVSCGWNSNWLIDENSNVWVSGCNKYDQLGFADLDRIPVFTQIPDCHNAKKVSASLKLSCLLFHDGSVLSFGSERKLGLKGRRNWTEEVFLILTLNYYTSFRSQKL